MKKIFVLLFALAMLLSLTALQAAADTAGAVSVPEGSDEQLKLIFGSFDSYKQDDGAVPWSYTVTDLDRNGRIELLAASIQGNGRFTTVKAWQVNQDKTGVDALNVPVAQGDSFPDIIIDAADAFHDTSADAWYYMFNDQITVSTQEVYANKSAILLDQDTLKFYTYAYQHNEWTDGRMVTTFTDRGGSIITPEEYNAADRNIFSNMDRSSVHFDWFPASDVSGAGRLADSYAIFLSLKQPAKPDTPAPAMTPRPDTPSSFLLITKNPTDEYRNAGDTAWFVANADNWSNATWTFVDSYGNECSWQSFRNRFAWCDVSGGDSSTVSISNTDPGMTGWGAYCTFYGNGQTARTTTAYLNIYQPAPTPPPPVPTYPVYNQMHGYVADYAMSTVTINLDNGYTVSPMWDICTVDGDINYGCDATVYYTGDYPTGDTIYSVYIQGSYDPPTPPVQDSIGATFVGATMSGAGFQLDNGDFVNVSSSLCSNYGNVTYGDSATVYYYNYPSAENIYHVDIYGRLYDDDQQSDDYADGDQDTPWLYNPVVNPIAAGDDFFGGRDLLNNG